MRKLKRVIHKQFGGIGNFFAMIILVSVSVIFINTYLLAKKRSPDDSGNSSEIPQDKTQIVVKNISYIQKEEDKQQQQQQQPKNLHKAKRLSVPDAGCEIEDKCTDDDVPYKVVSGDGMDKYPIICFNNKLLVHKNLKDTKIGRGVNLVAIDGQTFDVKATETFDTYLEETFFLRHLKMNLNDGDIIIMASFDEITYGLKEGTLSLLEKYGSQLIKIIKFRDAFVMIGQKGLARGKAIEMHQPKGQRDFAPAAHISGCAKFPLGPLTPLPFQPTDVKQDSIATGSSLRNCGLAEKCKDNEFAVHVYTGKDNNDEPKICIDGKYVMAKGINDAGRGLNIAVVSNGKEVIRTGHFDTWQDDSTNLEIFLENLEDNVILIAVTFDEASQKLSQHSRNLLFDLGSGAIQNLKYRDHWALVGQKGIKGFSPFEEISYAGSGNAYAVAIDKRLCVPQTLRGIKIRPDPLPSRNDKRRDFCSRYDGYGDFCSDTNVDKNLQPVPLLNKTLEDNPIYSTPILIIAGISHNSLRMCLETVLMQPGISLENVMVAVDEKFSEPLALIDLFGFRGEKTLSSSTYMEHYEKALKKVWELYPTKDKMIIIEEDLILSPDFLYTLALLSEPFRQDETIGGITMWNPNSYEDVDGSSSLIYRVDELYGLGYLLRRSFYDEHMKAFSECCSKRVWYRWKFVGSSHSFLTPDISRVFRRPVDGNHDNMKYLEKLFNRKRKTNLNPFPVLTNVDTLRKETYDTTLLKSIASATLLKLPDKCDTLQKIDISIENSSQTFKYIYTQSNPTDYSTLVLITRCFGLFHHESTDPTGLYHGILRFNSNKNHYYLIGSKSTFYSSSSDSSLKIQPPPIVA